MHRLALVVHFIYVLEYWSLLEEVCCLFMKRLRIAQWGGSILPPRNPRSQSSFSSTTDRCCRPHNSHLDRCTASQSFSRCFSVSIRASQQAVSVDNQIDEPRRPRLRPRRSRPETPSSQNSAKLAALHARLSLPARFSLQTLQRCMIHASANVDPQLNNSSLAILGQELLAYYTAEWLICNYPRLPMPVIFAAQYAYVGPKTLSHMRAEWGVDWAAAPGPEVLSGILQFEREQAGNAMAGDMTRRVKDLEGIRARATGRSNEDWNYRRGMSSRIVYDDEFGDLQSGVEIHDTISGLQSGSISETELVSTPAARGPLDPCLLYTSPSPRDGLLSRMPSSA